MKPPWIDAAESKIGVKEIRGGENPDIIEFHSTTTLKADEDEIAWCSSFVNWSVIKGGCKGTDSAAAASWLTWGLKLDKPIPGCIVVIKQKVKKQDKATGSTSGYHVGFFVKTEGGRIYLLGGNQGDQVKISSFGLSSYSVEEYRWPHEASAMLQTQVKA